MKPPRGGDFDPFGILLRGLSGREMARDRAIRGGETVLT
jgi:hypothetical protein